MYMSRVGRPALMSSCTLTLSMPLMCRPPAVTSSLSALTASRVQASPGWVAYRVVITPVTPGIWRICFSVTLS